MAELASECCLLSSSTGLPILEAGVIKHWARPGLGGEYKLSIREGAPYLQDRIRLVPRVNEGPPPPTADAAFRAALVVAILDPPGYAYKIRIASVVLEPPSTSLARRTLARQSASRPAPRSSKGTWRVSGVALSQMTTRATVRVCH